MNFVQDLIGLLSNPATLKILKFLFGYFCFCAIVDNLPKPADLKNPLAKFAFGTLHTLAGNLKNVAASIKVPGSGAQETKS